MSVAKTKTKARVQTTYAWRKGYPAKVSAKVAGRTIFEKLYSKHGYVNAELVVKEGAKKTSPIHDAFEWDDTVAGHRWRINQGAEMVRALRVVQVESPDNGDVDPFLVRVFLHTRLNGRMGYMAVADVMADDTKYQSTLAEAIRQLKGLRDRFEFIHELAGVFEVIDELTSE